MGYRNQRDISHTAGSGSFTITNHVPDVDMDCNSAADAEIADVLGEVIKQLSELGILNAAVSQ